MIRRLASLAAALTLIACAPPAAEAPAEAGEEAAPAETAAVEKTAKAPAQPNLVGAWRCVLSENNAQIEVMMTFTADGEFTAVSRGRGNLQRGLVEMSASARGGWTFDGATLTQTAQSSEIQYARINGVDLDPNSGEYRSAQEGGKANLGKPMTFGVADLTPTSFTLQQTNGQPLLCTRA